MIAKNAPIGFPALESAVGQTIRADDALQIVDKHFAAVEQQQIENIDAIVPVFRIAAVDGERELRPCCLCALVTIRPCVGRIVVVSWIA